MLAWRVAFWMFRAFPSLTMDHVGHSLLWAFFLHSNGHVAVLIVLGIFPFIAMRMLDIRCSGHLFFSFKRARCVLAVLVIFSFAFEWAGMLRFGCSEHLFPS